MSRTSMPTSMFSTNLDHILHFVTFPFYLKCSLSMAKRCTVMGFWAHAPEFYLTEGEGNRLCHPALTCPLLIHLHCTWAKVRHWHTEGLESLSVREGSVLRVLSIWAGERHRASRSSRLRTTRCVRVWQPLSVLPGGTGEGLKQLKGKHKCKRIEQHFCNFIGCVWQGMLGNRSEEMKLEKELHLAAGLIYHLYLMTPKLSFYPITM